MCAQTDDRDNAGHSFKKIKAHHVGKMTATHSVGEAVEVHETLEGGCYDCTAPCQPLGGYSDD